MVIVCTVLLGMVGLAHGFSESNGRIKWDPFPPEPDYQSGLLQMPHTLRDINRVAVAFIHALPPKQLPWGKSALMFKGEVTPDNRLILIKAE